MSRGPFNPIVYLRSGQVVVDYVVRVATEGLPERDRPDTSLPFRLHALFIDTATGKLRSEREWPTASARSVVLRSSGANFVVFTPDELLLYSPGLELLRELHLPLRSEATWETWTPSTSPQGRYLLVRYEREANSNTGVDATTSRAVSGQQRDAPNPTTPHAKVGLHLIDTEELRMLGSWTAELGTDRSGLPRCISDEGFLVLGDRIERFDRPWEPFFPLTPSLGCFIDDEVLFKGRGERGRLFGLELRDTHGQVFFAHNFPQNHDILPPIVGSCSAGKRLAFAFYKGKGGVASLDIAPHYSLRRIIVFDVPSRQWVYNLDGKRQRITKLSGLALSADGTQLAVIDQNGILRAYALPHAGSK